MSQNHSAPPRSSPYQLFVEGPNDQHSIVQLMTRHGYPYADVEKVRPYIHAGRGWPGVLELAALALKGAHRGVGLVIDADDEGPTRWKQVVEKFAKAGLALPEEPRAAGVVLEHESMRVGVWVMPDNSLPGSLEHFLDELIPPGDPCRAIAALATENALQAGAPLPTLHKRKGELHAWLAWQDPAGMPFGTAVRACCFRHDAPLGARFAAWFTDLFPDPP